MDCTPFGDFVPHEREAPPPPQKQERPSIFRPNAVLATLLERYGAVAKRAAVQGS